MTEISKPIFLMGSGRSGTTVLFHHLSSHPDVCWFSNYSNHLHMIPIMPVTQRFLKAGASGGRLAGDSQSNKDRKFSVRPAEGKKLYKKAGFPSDRKYTEDDYDPAAEARLKKIIERHIFWSGKPRFITKDTANVQRARLLNEMFPDALYIHLIRDGRAVTNSMINKGWLPVLDLWWTGDKAIDHVHEYEDPVELMGLHWKYNVEETFRLGEMVGPRYSEVRYEDLTSDVQGVMAKVMEFLELDVEPSWLKELPEKLPDMNDKWRTDLTERQTELLHNQIGDLLTRLNYKI
ncbi:MAG: sulfotransferase family protein [Gammaproteobacteria bacterium]